ncbi:MAG: LysR substrate-binding domain-containing protein [Pollutimonas bauzanensis]|uniref:DNA-binding transcriptional regulator, LysR family n=1 Tax=Pollutimonas bauzanensis TaxID=658167 RepID=A0A1M5Z0G2_9BURK|nr:LysR substrate-binding domain-containing protein [Pollutimonas bauzanensis]SHI17775.1 DNA-binding transcriptional regulator, LysR family [Pollutimonas bauzanensis]
MNLRQLRYFVVVAEELSFTRAADRLHISQPPLSQQIALLEEELGVKLFTRSNRRVELTEPGRVFLLDMRSTLNHIKNATVRVRAIEQGLAGRIEVGLSSSHFLGPLPRLIFKYSRTHPGVAVALNEMRPVDQIEALLERRVDICISRSPVDDLLLCSLPLWKDPAVVALPLGHRLAERRELKIADLKKENFVLLRREGSPFAQHIHERFAVAGFLPNIVQTVEEIPAQLYLVAAGLGIAIVPQSTRARIPGIASCRLTEIIMKTDVYGVIRKDNQKKALDAFLKEARQLKGDE